MKRCMESMQMVVAVVALAAAMPGVSEARPNPGGLGGPASGVGVLPGAGVRPGVGYGAPSAGMHRR